MAHCDRRDAIKASGDQPVSGCGRRRGQAETVRQHTGENLVNFWPRRQALANGALGSKVLPAAGPTANPTSAPGATAVVLSLAVNRRLEVDLRRPSRTGMMDS